MYDCVIVGAGPGGIVCCKEMLENGVTNVLCLEQSSDLGGTFSSSYDHLTLTSSAVMSMFSDFWIGDDQTQAIWTKAEAVAYWRRFAEHFAVIPRIRFNTRVSAVEQQTDGWWLHTDAGETFLCERLVIATGNNSIPRYPDWHARITSPQLQVLHAHDYKNSEAFAGKRVLVVGGGESGTDIALEISKVAQHCWISLRSSTGWVTPRKRGEMPADIATHRGLWGLPRSYGVELTQALLRIETGRNNPLSDAAVVLNKMVKNRLGAFGIYGTKSFALPIAMAEHGCQLVGDVSDIQEKGRRILTKDAQTLTDIDVIVFCTGYSNRVDFLPEPLQACSPRTLFKHMLHPDYGTRLAWLGWARPNFGSQFPIMEMQARYFAQLCVGHCSLPDKTSQLTQIAQDRQQLEEQFEDSARRIPSLVDYRIYMDDMAQRLHCTPPLWRYFFFHHRLWRKILFGALQGTQFRLRGLGRKPALARAILAQCPHLPLSHKLVRLGVQGRLKFALRGLVGQHGA